jgi:hypothetical protein
VTNVITLNRDTIYQDDLGVPTNSPNAVDYGFASVRNNELIDKMLTPFNYYGNAQVLGCNLIGEGAHTTQVNPAENTAQFSGFSDTTLAEPVLP